jgi:anti-sigma factor RsiW
MLPDAVDGSAGLPFPADVQAHVETCLRCQAELARYRRLLRALQQLRTRYLDPAPGLLAQTLASLEEAGEQRAVRSIVTGRRLAYAGAIGGAAVAAGAAATVVIVARSRRRGVQLVS